MAAAQVVTASGQVVHASAEENPELFWAIRGGGGNFGIVTAFEFAAHPTTDVFYGTIAFPAPEAAIVLQGWADYLRAAYADTLVDGATPPPSIQLVTLAGLDADRASPGPSAGSSTVATRMPDQLSPCYPFRLVSTRLLRRGRSGSIAGSRGGEADR